MGKSDNVPMVANRMVRILASKINEARQAQRKWKQNEEIYVEALHATVPGGAVNVTWFTGADGSGSEVVSVTEGSLPSKPPVDWAKYREAHPELEDTEFAKYYKPMPKPTVRTLTSWTEQDSLPDAPDAGQADSGDGQ